MIVPPAPQVAEDLTARKWESHETNSLLLGHQPPPVSLQRSIGELPPAVGIFCHAPFSSTPLVYGQTSESARAQVRRYIRQMGRLALAQMGAATVYEQQAQDGGGETHVASDDSDMTLVGVVLQLHDPHAVGDQLLLPWEFHRIDNLDDEVELDMAVKALIALRLSGGDGGNSTATSAVNQQVAAAARGVDVVDDAEDDSPLFLMNPHRLSLYTRLVTRFTGVYPASVICVKGTSFKRNRAGHVTALMVRQIYNPRRPEYPWEGSSGGIPRSMIPAISRQGRDGGARVQFCTGPFIRKELVRLAAALVRQATVRGVNVVIVGGPLVQEYNAAELQTMQTLTANVGSFTEELEAFVDSLERALAAHKNTTTRFVLVPSVNDVMTFPIVPQPCFALQTGDVPIDAPVQEDEEADDGGGSVETWGSAGIVEAVESIQVASNPCEILIRTAASGTSGDDGNGCVRFGVTTFDSVSLIREEMVERFPDGSGNSLHRVAETVLNSRLYVPIVSCPSPNHELAQLDKVALERPCKRNTAATEGDHDGVSSEKTGSLVSCPPHVLFMPSIRPAFAVVSHTANQDLSDPHGRGTLLINQCQYSTRLLPTPANVKLAEVTLTSIRAVALGGATAQNGVTVGTVEIYDSDI